VKARILYIDPVTKTVGLTLNPQLLNNITPALVFSLFWTLSTMLNSLILSSWNFGVTQCWGVPVYFVLPFVALIVCMVDLSDVRLLLILVQAVDVGDVFQNAVVRRVDATIGMLLELPIKTNATAGYVHVRISAEYQHLLSWTWSIVFVP